MAHGGADVDTVNRGARQGSCIVAILALWLYGCPSQSSSGAAPSTSPQKCTHVGQTCEYSPNKLGSCVMRDNCAQDCLVCQSQH